MNFQRRPILCTTLYRNPMQATNFGGTFDQLFLRIFYKIFTEDASQPLLYHGAKKLKMTKNSNQGGPAPCLKIVKWERLEKYLIDGVFSLKEMSGRVSTLTLSLRQTSPMSSLKNGLPLITSGGRSLYTIHSVRDSHLLIQLDKKSSHWEGSSECTSLLKNGITHFLRPKQPSQHLLWRWNITFYSDEGRTWLMHLCISTHPSGSTAL